MMGVSAGDARAMSFYEYEMRVSHWNDIHGEKEIEIVDPEVTQGLIDRLREHPDLLKKTKGQPSPVMPARLRNNI